MLSQQEIEELKDVLSKPEESSESLPEEEQEYYRQCQRSIIEAQQAAYVHEGQMVIF